MTAVQDSIRVRADPEAVLAILLDVEGYPKWQSEVDHADVLDTDPAGRPLLTRIWIKALGQVGSYTVAYDYPSASEVRYHLVEGDMMSRHDATFRVTPRAGSVEFVVELDLALKWPLPSMLVGVLARKGVREMLEAVKQLAEAADRA